MALLSRNTNILLLSIVTIVTILIAIFVLSIDALYDHDSHLFEFGPSDGLIFLGIKIDTWWKYIFLLLFMYYSWKRWKKDFIYLVEDNTVVPCKSFLKILIGETILQFFVSILSFWWISGVPACIQHWTGSNRRQQAYIWSILSIVVLIAHVVQWKMNSKEMDSNTYDHLQSEV